MLLRRRLVLLFVAVLLSVVVLAVVARATVRNRDDAIDLGRRADVAREQVAQLEAALADQETGQRGFLLTGLNSFLEPYVEGQRREGELVAELHRHDDAIAPVRARVDSVAEAAARWRQDAAEPEIALRRAEDAGETAGAVAAAVGTGAGKELFDEVRDRTDVLAAAVVRESRVADEERTESIRILTFVVTVIIVIGLLAIALIALLIRRWVTRPIDALVSDVRSVREGRLDAPIRSSGPPEIAELAEAINSMRVRLDGSRVVAERAREAIEQNAKVVLALRSQLEPEVGELAQGWTVAAQLRSAEGVVAGDCYDVAKMRDGSIALVVVDIAGHGSTEGILALRCKELLRASLAAGVGPGDAIGATAGQLSDMGEEVFLTAFVAVVDTTSGRVRYANAGHPPAYVCGDDGDIELGPTGPLVGLLDHDQWGTGEVDMTIGDNLCAYTDGLIEVRNTTREFFGPERLLELIRGARCEEAPIVVKRVLDEVELFAHARLHDDATIVVLCRAEAGVPPPPR